MGKSVKILKRMGYILVKHLPKNNPTHQAVKWAWGHIPDHIIMEEKYFSKSEWKRFNRRRK